MNVATYILIKLFGSRIETRLVEKARAGDSMAVKKLYELSVGQLTATCMRYIPDADDAKDVLQTGFVKIFKSLGKFENRGEGSLKAWMNRIIVNESLKFLRERKKSDTVSYMSDLPETTDVPEDDESFANIPQDEVMKMIRALPEGYRTIFNLYVFEDRSHKEIAELLGITESTSASQLHRAKALLMKQIQEFRKNGK
jgi:RNA polymerase sigma-70 factor (ECF subfamily)